MASVQVYQFYRSPKTDGVCAKSTQQTWITTNFNNTSNAYTLGGVDFGETDRKHYNMVGDEDPIAYGYLKAQFG